MQGKMTASPTSHYWWNSSLVVPTPESLLLEASFERERAWGRDEVLILVMSSLLRECTSPKLTSFRGRAKDFSPRARIRHWMG